MSTHTPHAWKTWHAWLVVFAFLFLGNIALPFLAGIITGGGQ